MFDQNTRVLLLRHGEVASHRGDVPVTEQGLAHAERTGKTIAEESSSPFTLLFGGTRRTRQTAEALARGIGDPDRIDGPRNSFALRNPDMYIAGTRVNMVSSAEALAEQVTDLTATQVEQNDWWTTFFRSSDRIGWWLQQTSPPGETAPGLAGRIERFARTIADPGPLRGRLVICLTHSPVLRAVLRSPDGTDPGEPAYITGVEILVEDGDLHITDYDPLND